MQSTTTKGNSIAIIGAGFAGLNCARVLKSLGYKVRVFEASCRVGGRVHTGCYAPTEERVEFGGEFIGKTHTTWLDLARRYNLTLSDYRITETKAPCLQLNERKYVFDDKDLSQFSDQIHILFSQLSQLSLLLGDTNEPWNDDKEIQKLDSISLGHFLEEKQQEWKISPETMAYFRFMYERDNLTPIHQQSLLGTLCRIKAGGGHDFWANIKNYRCLEGNATLARLMSEEQEMLMEHEVSSIETKKNGIRICFRNKAREEKRERRGFTGPVLFEFPELFDFVVLAVPNACLKNIQFYPSLPLHDYTVHTGYAGKLVCQPTMEVKISDIQFNSESDVFGEIWSTPMGFNVFLGYPQTGRSDETIIKAVESVAPFGRNTYSFERVDYSRLPFSGGGYTCLTVGQTTHQLRNLNQIVKRNRLAFAGEACEPGFFGTMEGALRSGETTALRINQWLKTAFVQ